MVGRKAPSKTEKRGRQALPSQDKLVQQLMLKFQDNFADLPDAKPARSLVEEFLAIDPEDAGAFGEIRLQLVEALVDLRIAADNGDLDSRQEADDLRNWLPERLKDETTQIGFFFGLAQVFGEAEFDPSAGFVAVFDRRLADIPTDVFPEMAGALLSADLGALGAEDAVEFHGMLLAITRYLPPRLTAAFLDTLSRSNEAGVQEALLGFLLQGGHAATILGGLAAFAHGRTLPERFLRRLALLSSLLGEAERAQLQAVLAGSAFSARPTPRPAAKPVPVNAVYGSLPDGGGSQLIGLHQGKGKKAVVTTFLVRAGKGIADVLIYEGMSKLDLEMMMRMSGVEISAIGTDTLFHQLGLRVAQNRASGTPIPFALLAAMDNLGLPSLREEVPDAEAVFEAALGRTRIDPVAPQTIAAAHRAVAKAGICKGWFEANEEIAELVNPDLDLDLDQRIEALLDGYLPKRRAFWIEQCVWSTLILKDPLSKRSKLAPHLAALGLQLCRGAPVAESPLMRDIAEGSVTALMQSDLDW